MSKKAKAKHHIDKADLTVRNWQGKFICACGSIAMARRIARALSAMEDNPKAKPFAFDWSGIPEKYKWAAMDDDKEWWVYSKKPKRHPSGLAWYSESGFSADLVAPPYPGDWRNSLQQRP